MFLHVSSCFPMFHHVSPYFNMFHHVSACFSMFHHVSPRGQFDHENSCPASVLEAISASKVWIEGSRLSSQWKYKCHLGNCWRTTSWYQKMFLFGPWWRPWCLPLTSVFVSILGGLKCLNGIEGFKVCGLCSHRHHCHDQKSSGSNGANHHRKPHMTRSYTVYGVSNLHALSLSFKLADGELYIYIYICNYIILYCIILHWNRWVIWTIKTWDWNCLSKSVFFIYYLVSNGI